MAADSQRRRLNLVDFKPIFVTYLHPTVTFLTNLAPVITTEEANDIQNLMNGNTREAGVSSLLQKLENKQQEPGIFTQVVRALEQDDQGHIAEMLKNGQKVPDENTRRVKYLIDVFAVVLTKVDPKDMGPHLRCLNNEEQTHIESCTRMVNKERGALKMFSLLVLKGSKEMFTQLVEALKKTGYPNVAADLEDLQKSDCDDSDCCEEEKEQCEDGTEQESIPVDNESVASCVTKIHQPHAGKDDLGDALRLPKEGRRSGRECVTEHDSFPVDNDGAKIHQPHAENEELGDALSLSNEVAQVQQPPERELILRSYQEELAAPALPEGGSNNIVVVAPTGSGKTLVAVKVTMEFLKCGVEGVCSNVKPKPPKVVFLVNQVTLVHQQTQLFQQYLGTTAVIGVSGETARELNLDTLLKKKPVMVMTAQVLVNALRDSIVCLADIGLLILDECHNCQKGTPYNRIMSIYRDMVIGMKEPRPQILGMSASLDIGQAKSGQQAVEKVWQMCANLDARLISLVSTTDGKRELEEHLNIPIEHIVEVPGRTNDKFLIDVSTSMKMIEDVMFDIPGFREIVESNPQLRTAGRCGSQTYEQWVVQGHNDILEKVKKGNPNKRKLITCMEHLKVYNNSLYINRDIRTIDAVSKLDAYLADQTVREDGFDETDQFLVELLKEKIPKLKAIGEDPSSRNPVLYKLGEILRRAFQPTSEIPEKRGILFTKTRESVEALIKWITETEELKFLNPGRLIGSGRYGGMTQKQQVDMLQLFRKGNHKLIVATTVAQEGLDIAACNVVVQYNCVSNVVAHVQARGRNRAKGGQFFMVLDEQQKLSDKTLTNRIREQMMQEATRIVHRKMLSDPQDSRKKIVDIQKAEQMERKQKESNEARRKKLLIKDKVTLTCRKCGVLACHNYDIRCVKDAHRIVISDAFKNRCDTKPNSKYPRLIDGLDMRMTLVCAKCKQEWGTQAIYKGMELPLLNIAGFVAEYPNGIQKRVKKWKDVAFQVEPVAYTDLKTTLDEEARVSVEE